MKKHRKQIVYVTMGVFAVTLTALCLVWYMTGKQQIIENEIDVFSELPDTEKEELPESDKNKETTSSESDLEVSSGENMGSEKLKEETSEKVNEETSETDKTDNSEKSENPSYTDQPESEKKFDGVELPVIPIG